SLVYGVRYEHTRARHAGKAFDGDAVTPVVYRNRYGLLAPSLNIRQQLSGGRQLRFGMFRSMVRPGFGETAAGAEIDFEDNEISGGNPDLAPTRAWNFDLGFDWHAGPETFLAAGLFYKHIDDAIV